MEESTKDSEPVDGIAPYTGEHELKPVPKLEKEKEKEKGKKSEAQKVMEETDDIQGDFDFKDILSKDKKFYRVQPVTEVLSRVDSTIMVPRAKELEELDGKDGSSNWRIAIYIQIRMEELHPDNRGRHRVLVQTLGKIINKFLTSVKTLSPGDVEKVMRVGGCISRLIALKPPECDEKGRKIIVSDGARRKCDYYYQVMVGNRNFIAEEFRREGIEDERQNMEHLERSGWIFHGIDPSAKGRSEGPSKDTTTASPSSS